MKKYEYASLTRHTEHGLWFWYLNGVRLGSNLIKDYEELGCIQILNKLGQDGWKLVTYESDTSMIIMKETER